MYMLRLNRLFLSFQLLYFTVIQGTIRAKLIAVLIIATVSNKA
jgi:hypothetical protein